CSRYEVVPLSVIVNCLAKGTPLPSQAAAITVDDGYCDFYEVAFPVLQKFNAPATVFVVADFLDGKQWIWTDRLRYLLRRAARSELVGGLIAEYTTEQGLGRRLEVRRQGGRTAVAPPAGTMEGVHRLTDEKAKARAAESINSVLKSLPEGQRAM